VIGRDAKIAQRPLELAAYHSAKVHMFLLPGEATTAELVELLSLHLRAICARTTEARVRIWRITRSGLAPM
jgi:hypothetical protein